MKNNEKGFGAVEGLLVLLIVIIIGVAGWFVYDRSHNKTTPTSTTTPATTTTPTTTTTETKETNSPQDAVTSTQKFYTAFVKYANNTPAPSSSEAAQYYSNVKPDVTTTLYNKLLNTVGYNPITCSQQQLTKATVKLNSSTSTEANMYVYEYNLSGDLNTSKPIKVTAQLSDLKLTDITCQF
jgi:hypothetical protein